MRCRKLALCLVPLLAGLFGFPPAVVAAPEFVTAWGSDGSGPGQFVQAEGIAVDDSFHVYVVDHGTHRIEKFTRDGVFLLQWGGQGAAAGQFTYPSNVAVDHAFNVYVTDTGNNRVEKFNSMGMFLTQWGSLGSLDGQFHGPLGIAVDDAGANVYVVDPVNPLHPLPTRIERFSSSGAFLGKWGTQGCCAPGQFLEPEDVAVSSSNHVYVIDAYSCEVQEFDPSGAFIAIWGGGVGTEPGSFQDPAGIEVDRRDGDRVYVVDSSNYRVQVFGPAGAFQELFGDAGGGPGQFWGPCDAAMDPTGFIYVADSGNYRVEKFLRSNLAGVGTGPDDASAGMRCVPNPCREQMRASFRLATAGLAHIEVFDFGGRRVRQLADEPADAGVHTVEWDLRDGSGTKVSPGIYLLRVTAPAGRLTSRVLVLD